MNNLQAIFIAIACRLANISQFMRCGYKTGLTLDFLHSVRVKSGPDQVRGSNVGTQCHLLDRRPGSEPYHLLVQTAGYEKPEKQTGI